MMKRIALVALVLLVLPAAALAADGEDAASGGDGVVEGVVVNGTRGGSSAANLEVTLETYRGDQPMDPKTATTDEDGRFVFEGVPTGPDYVHRTFINYATTEYFGEVFTFPEGEVSFSTSLTVYDATSSDESIVVESSHTVVDSGKGGLYITEVYSFMNQGDRSYVGATEVDEGKMATLYFPLPEGAIQIELGTGLMQCCFFAVPGGFVDTMPFPPGGKQVVYSYFVPNKKDEYTFLRSMQYPTGRYVLLVQGENATINSDRLIAEEQVVMQDALYAHASGEDFDRGDAIEALMSGLAASGSDMAIIWSGVTLAVLAGGYGFYYLLRRKKQMGPAPLPAADPAEERRRLLLRIAEMDDEFAAGRIAEAPYRAKRAELKELLLNLTQRTGSG